jgi:HNH endonuclease
MRTYLKPCDFEGCHGKAKAHGLCTGHLDQRARGLPLSPIKQRRAMCEFPDCGRKHFANGLCRAHRQQQRQSKPLTPIGSRLRGTGRWVDPKGYVWVRGPTGHPNAKRGNWIAEHVWVMSQVLGRPLRRGESVHHRNNIKHDNRPENLQLWHTHQPRGASVEDTVRWAHWFLEQYGEEFTEEPRSRGGVARPPPERR